MEVKKFRGRKKLSRNGEKCTDLVRRNGCITEANFTEMKASVDKVTGVSSFDNEDRDNLARNCQRAIWINHEIIVERDEVKETLLPRRARPKRVRKSKEQQAKVWFFSIHTQYFCVL